MNAMFDRRSFLARSLAAGGVAGMAGLDFLARLAPVAGADAKLPSRDVRFDSGIEPLVQLLEETPRQRVLEEFATRIRQGTTYREVLAALLLAGVRNIQPRPVGFKFHAVLVINSAHLASINSPDADRWLPIFWALDQFKRSQARDVQEGDWTMGPVDESAVPSGRKAKQAFIDAMDDWDPAAADSAVAGLARSMAPQEIFECFARYGSRDFRDIGHKAIYVANSWRTLQNIGWQHAEPVLRSLAYALLEHEQGNPARRDAPADLPGRENDSRVEKIREGWMDGTSNAAGAQDMLQTLRQAGTGDAADKAIELLNRGVAPSSVWDGIFQAAGELLMRQPGIISLHSVTAANAIHYAWQHASTDRTRRWLLLQATSFLTLFRERLRPDSLVRIDELKAAAPSGQGIAAVDEIFSEINRNRHAASEKTLGFLEAGGAPREFINTARRLIYLKGTDSHDYKFSEAALEDYRHLAPQIRDRFLAASVFYLRGSGSPDNELVQRTREALRTRS